MVGAGRCLVTGADGFIGSALVRRLEGVYGEVWRLVRPGSAGSGAPGTLTADLAADVPELGPLAPLDAIFHLAGRAHKADCRRTEQADHFRDNVEGTRNLLTAAAACDTRRLVFASSVAVMGAGTSGCLDESAPPRPVAAYGRTKLLAEELVLGSRGTARPEGVVLRLPLVYGAGQKGNLDRLLQAVLHGRFPPPPRAINRRSVVHVEDVVDALMLAACQEAAAGRTFLVCEGEPCSTRALYDWTREALGRRPVSWGLPRALWRGLGWAGDGAVSLLGRPVGFDSTAVERLLGDAWYSSARIERELGWQPRRRLREELPVLIAGLVARTSSRREAV